MDLTDLYILSYLPQDFLFLFHETNKAFIDVLEAPCPVYSLL